MSKPEKISPETVSLGQPPGNASSSPLRPHFESRITDVEAWLG